MIADGRRPTPFWRFLHSFFVQLYEYYIVDG